MSSNINISVDIHKDYPFDEFVFIMRDCYSRNYIVMQMMKLLVPVRWRRAIYSPPPVRVKLKTTL